MLTFSRLGNLGRLGNQLFQIAFISHFAQKYSIPYVIPKWEYAAYFDYAFPYVEKLPVLYDYILTEPTFCYNESYFAGFLDKMHSHSFDFIGYFQSYKYFSKQHVLNVFKPSHKFIPIKLNRGNSVAISVRRGDFVEHPDYNNIEYFNFLQILKNFSGFGVYIFSDDFDYCRQHFVGSQYIFMEGMSAIEQLLTMRTFDYFVLSNSTFSYWGAMLSENPKKIYFPQYMFPNIDRCQMYNDDYWPKAESIYIPYENPINK